MSLLKKCDICGKSQSNKVTFDSRPISLQLDSPTHKRPYNIFLTVAIEDADDTISITELKKNPKFMKDVMQGNTGSIYDYMDLNNPYPCICIKCKRELAKLALSYGREGELVTF